MACDADQPDRRHRPPVDDATAGLLDGVSGGARIERADLIGWLLTVGFSVDQIQNAVEPMTLPVHRESGDDGTRVAPREISASSGVDLDLLQQLLRAAGLAQVDDPDARLLARIDAEAVLSTASLVDMGFDAQEMILFVRVAMVGLRRAAAVLREAAWRTILVPGATELQLAKAGERLARPLWPMANTVIVDLFGVAMRQQLDAEAVTLTERANGSLAGARDITVAFADLVGFTRLGEALPAEELARVAVRFAALAYDLVEAPVQFVKSIGDAVMLVCPSPLTLLDTVFRLRDAAARERMPQLRVGLAYGSAANRFNDWFGSPVNVADRVTGAAKPGEILVTESLRVAIGDNRTLVWSPAAARNLKGVSGRTRLWRVTRQPAP